MTISEEWKNLFHLLTELSSVELQKERWFNSNSQYVSSYTELLCGIFDDNNFDIFIDEYLSQKQAPEQLLKDINKLRNKLNNFNIKEELTDLEIISNKDWIEITKISKDIIKQIHFDGNDK